MSSTTNLEIENKKSDQQQQNNNDKRQKREYTDAEKKLIEKNRLKALQIRQSKLVPHPYAKSSEGNNIVDKAIIKVQGTRFVDSGGGFLIEESAIKLDSGSDTKSTSQSSNSTTAASSSSSTSNEAIAIPISYDECLECGDQFVDSYLFNNFKYPVCDKCRDPDEKHALITRTQAKDDYLLKDCDLDKREPILKYISRKNPHNVRWGEMKLYLLLQIEKRALEIWGSMEEIERQREKRVENRTATKIKKYNKKLKQLRMDVRSSLYDKTTPVNHTHEFGSETYNEDDDTYTHSCLTCQYEETFEKM